MQPICQTLENLLSKRLSCKKNNYLYYFIELIQTKWILAEKSQSLAELSHLAEMRQLNTSKKVKGAWGRKIMS